MSLTQRIESDFSYHETGPLQNESMRVVRNMAKDLALTIATLVPTGREQSLALTELEAVVFWSSAGISRGDMV